MKSNNERIRYLLSEVQPPLDEWAELLKHNISSHWGRQFFGLFYGIMYESEYMKIIFFL